MNNEVTETEEIKNEPKKKKSIFKTILKIIGLLVLGFILLVFWTAYSNSKDPLDNYPMKIKNVEKENAVKAIDDFIDRRNESVKEAIKEFDKYIKSIENGKDYSNYNQLFNYGFIILNESDYKKDADKIVRNYIKNNANGVYVNEKEEERLRNKAEKIEEEVDNHKKYIKKKYKEINLTDKISIWGSEIYRNFIYLKLAKDFVLNNLKQEDIDEGILDYKFKLTNTNKAYNNVFEAKPELWNKFMKKEYSGGLSNYYYMNAFTFTTNNEYHMLDREVKSLVEKIVDQSVHATRVGYYNTEFTNTGVNNYLSDSGVFNKIESMTEKSILIIKDVNVSKENYLPLNEEIKYQSDVKIKIKKKNPKYKPYGYMYNYPYNSNNKKVPETITEVVIKYQDIVLTRKVGTYKQGYSNKFINGYEVKYKEVEDKESTALFGGKNYYTKSDIFKEFNTLEEAKNYIHNELKAKKIDL